MSVLDAPPGTCGAAPDKLRLVAMNGIDLQRDAYLAHAELARRCGALLPVVLADDQGQTAALACTKALPAIVIVTLAP